MKQLSLVIWLMIIFIPEGYGQIYQLSGQVFDSETNAPLSGANIIVNPGNLGMASDSSGNFSFHVKDSVIILKISFVGYENYSNRISLKKISMINIGLTPGDRLSEVTVSDSPLGEPSSEVNRVIMPMKKVESLPMVLGEPDVMKALQLLPGVQSGMEGTAGLYVRGGGSGENLILLDNIPVYNSDHLFGLFSSFNPNIIRQASLIKGGFPARYGERLSSVIELQTIRGNDTKYRAEGSVGLISSNLVVSGPVIKNKITFSAGFRRSYLDLFSIPLSKILSKNDVTVGYFLQDLNGRLDWKLNNKHNVFVTLYKNDDNFYSFHKSTYKTNDNTITTYKEKTGLKWGNFIVSSGLESNWSDRFHTTAQLAYNRYRFQVYNKDHDHIQTDTISEDRYDNYIMQSRIADINFKADALYQPGVNQKIRFGADLFYHRYIPELFTFTSNTSDDYSIGSDSVNAREENFYIEDEINLAKVFTINLGLRQSNFHVNGKDYSDLQPRFSADWKPGQKWHINSSYTEMDQYVHLLINGQLGIPVQYWVPVTSRTEPQHSRQFTIGISNNINRSCSFSVEGYYKTMKNLLEYTEDPRLYNSGLSWEDKVESGDGTAYGLEFLFQKKLGKVSGWVSYTLSRSLRQFDNLNMGKTFPYTYDRIHDISVAASYHASEKIELSADWMFLTGIAFTAPLYTYPEYSANSSVPNYYQTISLIGYSDKNALRYSDFHRLDLGIQFKKKKKWGERAWVISVINVYNRKNPFYLQVKENLEQKRLYKYSFFQIVPSVSYQFKF